MLKLILIVLAAVSIVRSTEEYGALDNSVLRAATTCPKEGCKSCDVGWKNGISSDQCNRICTAGKGVKKCTCACPDTCGSSDDCPAGPDNFKASCYEGNCHVTYYNKPCPATISCKRETYGSGKYYDRGYFYLSCTADGDCASKLKSCPSGCEKKCRTFTQGKNCACYCPGTVA